MYQQDETTMRNLWVREEGATMLEYGLMISLIALAAVTAVTLFGMAVSRLFDNPL
jgi:Flp pilus assembly pilin Flp